MTLKLNRIDSGYQKNEIFNHHYFDSSEALLGAIEKEIIQTDIVADIGCGIVPMNYFRPQLHIMIDPWKEYTDILSYRYRDDKSIMILNSGALETLKMLSDNAVDSIFMLDIIEHVNKEEGKEIIKECERVAGQQIILFTSLGFLPQEVCDKDAWGLSGISVQQHRSGWEPKDFSDAWDFYICNTYHRVDYKNDMLPEPHGAFFAIRCFEEKSNQRPKLMSDIRRPLPSEVELQKALIQLKEAERKLEKILSFRIVKIILQARRFFKKYLNVDYQS